MANPPAKQVISDSAGMPNADLTELFEELMTS